MTEEQAQKILNAYKKGPHATPEALKFRNKNDAVTGAVEALKMAAAENVRITMPNYSNTLSVIRALKRKGLNAYIAPFVSFNAEVLRLSAQTPFLALKEINDGRKLGGPEGRGLARMGSARLASYSLNTALGAKGVAMMTSLLYTMYLTAKDALDGDDDEEFDFTAEAMKRFRAVLNNEDADVKRFLSEWYREGHIAVLDINKEDGTVTWADVSHLIPQSEVTGPVTRVLAAAGVPWMGSSDDSLTGAIRSSLGDLFAPYVNKQIWVETFLGTDTNESSMLNEINQGLLPRDLGKKLKDVSEIALPGILTDIYKVVEAVNKGDTMYRGRSITPGQEIASAIFGQKVLTTDIRDKFERRLQYTSKILQDAKRGWKDGIRGGTKMTAKEIRKLTKRWKTDEQEIIKRAHKDYLSAEKLTARGEASRILNSSGLSSGQTSQIKHGYYSPSRPSKYDIREGRKQERKHNTPGLLDATYEVIRETPEPVYDFRERG